MQSFRSFLEREELAESRFKGFKRQFVGANPGLPQYVANDLYNNRVGYSLGKRLKKDMGVAPTTGNLGDQETTPSRIMPTGVTKDILGSHGNFQNITWSKPMVINISPKDFDEDTLRIFLVRQFGFNPTEKIRKDAFRTTTQRELLVNRGANNEPIIVVKNGNKYKLLEGWHRTMSYLVSQAPPDQIDALKQGDATQLNFARWKKVPIRAYVGEMPNVVPFVPQHDLYQAGQLVH